MSSRNYLKHPLLVAALALGGLAAVPAHAAQDEASARSVIIARGSGEVQVRPDAVHIDVGAEAQAATIDEARTRVSGTMSHVLEALRALPQPGLTIETRSIRFTPVYAPAKEGRAPSITGFTAANRVLVTSGHIADADLAARTAQIVDTALNAGATDVGGIDFFLVDPSVAEDQALSLAVQNAERDAQTIARAASVTLAGPLSIEEDSASRTPRSFTLEAAAAVATPIAVGDISIQSSVTAKYAFR